MNGHSKGHCEKDAALPEKNKDSSDETLMALIDKHGQQQRDRIRDSDLAVFISSAAFGGGISIADEQHQAVVVKEIHNVIAKMKPIYSDVGKLHIKGHTNLEISELLEIPEGTAKSRLRKFRQFIREYLEKDILPSKNKKS